MPLQSSGQISLDDLHVEAGGTSGTTCSLNDSDIRGLIGAAANSQMTFGSFYGASNVQSLTLANPSHYYSPYSSASGSSSPTTNFSTTYPTRVMVTGTNTLNVATYGTTFCGPQGSISSRDFMGQTSQLWTGFHYSSNPGGTGFMMFSVANPASTSGSNSGWTSVTLSAYGTAWPLGVQTTRTYSHTVTRASCVYVSNTNIPPYQSFSYGYNNRWRHFISPYASTNPSYTGDQIGHIITAADSSANNGAGITITYT